jgi:endonuclease I
VDTSSPAALRASLHVIIDDHQRYPYTSGGTDTWDILEHAMEDPNNAGRILDVYHNEDYTKVGGGNSNYDREHTWPHSFGFPNYGGTNYPYTDCHMLMLCDSTYNSSRGNKPFRACGGGCDELVTVVNNGQGGQGGGYPGNSNWRSSAGNLGTFEVWSGRRGDVARALLYADVRYEGGNHGSSGASEPDLILTDDESLIIASQTGQNESVAHMGMLSVLLQWHEDDPVDTWERRRNDVVFGYQHNRNPFVDHPEWVACLFLGPCCGFTATCPGAVNGTGQVGEIVLLGSASVAANDLVLAAVSMTTNQFGVFFYGPGEQDTPFGNGRLCVSGSMARLDLVHTGNLGFVTYALDNTAPPQTSAQITPGTAWHFQFWYRDPGGPGGASHNLSGGVRVDFCE